MNFTKLFVIFAIVLIAMMGQTEARPGWLKKLGKKIEGVGKRTFKAAAKVVPVASEAASAFATFKGAQG